MHPLLLPILLRKFGNTILRFGYGYAPPLILEQAVRYRVFEILEDGAKSASEVSASSGTSLRGITLLLNALVGLGFLRKKADKYSNVKRETDFILARRNLEVDAIIRKTGLQTRYYELASKLLQKWLKLGEAVQLGAPVAACNQESTGTDYFIEFAEAMFANSFRAAHAYAKGSKNPVVGQALRILDLGAGSAAWSAPWALACSEARVMAVDWEGVLPVAQRVAASLGISAQYEFVAGDVLTADLGKGHHLAFLGHVIHTEGELRSRELIKRCFDALEPGGSLVIAEWVPNDERTGPTHVVVYALAMLLASQHGDAFTFSEMKQWLVDGGFTDVRKVLVPAPSPLIVATKPRG